MYKSIVGVGIASIALAGCSGMKKQTILPDNEIKATTPYVGPTDTPKNTHNTHQSPWFQNPTSPSLDGGFLNYVKGDTITPEFLLPPKTYPHNSGHFEGDLASLVNSSDEYASSNTTTTPLQSDSTEDNAHRRYTISNGQLIATTCLGIAGVFAAGGLLFALYLANQNKKLSIQSTHL